MASKIDITLKRFNGVDIDELFPTTHMGQIYTDSAQTKLLNTYLDETFIPLSQRGAANGVATLDQFQKLTASQLPAYLFGGMTYAGVLNLTSGADIDDIMEAADPGDTPNKLSAVGEYLQVSATGILSQGSTWTATVLPPGDEGDYTLPITFENGDWVVVNAIDHANNTVTFAVVNNTYQYATDALHGIVRLTDAVDTGDLTNGSIDVITEDFLFDNIKTGELNGGTNGANDVLDGIASSSHIHDGRYYTETEVAAFFSGSTAITGYNKTNWDAAYNDKINSAAFDTQTGVITLTQQDGGTVTVDIDDRYAESITAAQTDSTDGIDIVKTGNSYTVGHHDTSSIADVSNANGNVLQSMTFDTFGHVQTQTSVNLDGRYYTETEFNDWLDGPVNGTAIDGHFFTEIIYGANPTSTVAGTILIDED